MSTLQMIAQMEVDFKLGILDGNIEMVVWI